jgi:hypothetical protein
MPNLKHRFRVSLRGGYIDTSESYLDFMQNVISVDYDLVAKTVTVVCRDDCLSLTAAHIGYVLKQSDASIQIDHLSDGGDRYSSKKWFSGCEAISHASGMHYGESDQVTHKMVFKYRRFESFVAEVMAPEPVTAPNENAPPFDPKL